ncbi:MAG: molybdopterin molybdotransferase MoeA [Caulobacteraceae bacterium]
MKPSTDVSSPARMLAVEAARARMLAAVRPLESERIPLSRALGRVLASDLLAERNQPPFSASAMDGWAVRSADGSGERRILGESAAGRGFEGRVGSREAVRIFTGAALPKGADAVVIQEDARRAGEAVRVPAVPPGRHVRPAGGDFRTGERLLTAPIRLDPWRLGLAAAAGAAFLEAARRPKIALLSTGEEIVEAGGKPGPFQIYDSGGPSLAALIATWGGEAMPLAIASDDMNAIGNAVELASCDLLVTLGGASVGDHDLVKPALTPFGLGLAVESVAVRPGKPTWFGSFADGRLVLGLPGNPASALVCAELFLKPLVDRFQGLEGTLPLVTALAVTPLQANGAREHWMRAKLSRNAHGALLAEPFGDQDSALVTVFAAADGLIRREAGAPALVAGERIEVLSLARL